MPELPEVETIVLGLRGPLTGQTIVGVDNNWPAHIARPSLEQLRRRITGRRIEEISRRGKYLVFRLDEGETLIIHLKMTGQLEVVNRELATDRHVHTSFPLASGDELRFRDVRKFGRVYLVRDPSEVLGKLGPEPLSSTFTEEWLFVRLRERKRALKPLLLDQAFVAGIGNIYADEALHYAKLHPQRRSNTLSASESKALHSGIQTVLKKGIKREGASIDSYRKPDGGAGNMQNSLMIYGRRGEHCYRCDEIVERIISGGRSTHFCPGCQL